MKMRATLVRRLRALILVCVVVASFSSVETRARAAGSPSSDDEKQARMLYERAEKSFDVGKFPEALADYQAAYEAKPLPGFLFNIAQCYRNMGNFERARFFFRRYLALEPRAANRRKVEELIGEMTKQLQLDEQKVAAPATAPPPAEAEPKAAAPAPVEPAPAPVAPPAAPVPPAAGLEAPAPTAAPLVTAPAGPVEAQRPVTRRWWFWTGLGAVVVGGAVAAFFLTRPETKTPGSLDPIDGRM